MQQNLPSTPVSRQDFSTLQYPCGFPGCRRVLKTAGGRTKHRDNAHPPFIPLPTHLINPNASTVPKADGAHRDNDDTLMDDGFDGGEQNEPMHNDSEPIGRSSPIPEVDAHFYGPGGKLYRNYHTSLNGKPCDSEGIFLAPNTPAAPLPNKSKNDWTPYRSRLEFETAEFLFTRNQMSAGHIDTLLNLWGASLFPHGESPPFANHKDLYKVIDATRLGDVNWQSFSVRYQGHVPEEDTPPWMQENFDVWFRDPREIVQNMLGNPDYVNDIDYRPFREYSTDGDIRQYHDFMSGDWAWEQADIIAQDPETHGSTFVPIILGSDKTTVSVATGQNDYYPLYVSIGNVHNNIRRAHRNALALVAFLAIPKTTKEHANSNEFRKFRRQLFHCSLSRILDSFKPAMTKPEIVRCGDSHFRRIIYGLGPYIADYEEQVLLACIVRNWCGRCLSHRENLDAHSLTRSMEHTEVLLDSVTLGELWDQYGIVGDLIPFTNDFPRSDIHQLLAPDLLHQIIKGVFKDHLVDWVERYIKHVHGVDAPAVMDDIDRRIAAVAPFSGLRRFPQGRGFKQWTGDDSKALMKVYLPAIEGHVPPDVVRTFRAFLEFCYLVRRNIITEDTLVQIEDALNRFHHYRKVFHRVGIVFTFSLPRQHAMSHYPILIRLFGAPNGLCSSITESKHIKAVKQPYRRSSRFRALGQMLITNQRLDKIAAARTDFINRGMLDGNCLTNAVQMQDGTEDDGNNDANNNAGAAPTQTINIANAPAHQPSVQDSSNEDNGETDNGPTCVEAHVQLARTPRRKCPRRISSLAVELNIPDLPHLVRSFLFDQMRPHDPSDVSDVSLVQFPEYTGKISIFNSASSRFYAPSDISGIGGMRTEYIRACPKWRNEHPRYDCVFLNIDPELRGMRGLEIARVLCFFSFELNSVTYPCAIIHWFDKLDDAPDEDTGMWMVKKALTDNTPNISVVHIDTIYRAAHLIPIYGNKYVSPTINFHQSLDEFGAFYVNKYADHHAFEIAF
ncbi:hypothetical protein BJ138DRAFT_1118986 [Hygrophoropsis aurantiaca]|uniref:Uncharacterized protein n=1 Tax=Hygrophoropsis aurantiaca TaxID=72124 RepID=A0ACB7ZVI5_9AGAM|nr:hypothetical protein BJ138DRAFT_1118986 [Hygrophoropsis aurantiaca]